MKTAVAFSVLYFVVLPTTLTPASAQTGRCHAASDIMKEKSWEAINYKYSPAYIEENRATFQQAVDNGSAVLLKDCQSNNMSDEQIILQGALAIAALPIKTSVDIFLKGLGLPETGDQAFHVSVKDIEKHGVFGGSNSFFRKPFG